jgi:hypothetical protein
VLEPGDQVELACTTNQLPLHPWHVHCLWFLFLYGALCCAGFFVPAIRNFVEDHLVSEVLIAVGIGWIGMIIYFRRAYVAGAWRPEIAISLRPSVEGSGSA